MESNDFLKLLHEAQSGGHVVVLLFKSREGGITGIVDRIANDYVAIRRPKDARACEFVRLDEIAGFMVKRWNTESEDCYE